VTVLVAVLRPRKLSDSASHRITVAFFHILFLAYFTNRLKLGDTTLVEALGYKPEGRGFDSRWCHSNLLLTKSFRSHSARGIDIASNKNMYQGYFLWGRCGWFVRLTALTPSCADWFEIWEPQPAGTLRACNKSLQALLHLKL